MEYYHNLVTQKSFELLKTFTRKYQFILIGGWAVFVLTKSLKSKDIDIVVDFPELEKLRQDYALTKNDRLKKYEIKVQEIDVDIYPFHYSNPGLPAEDVAKFTIFQGGFHIPHPEILLILKQQAHNERQGTPKGEKDKIDILSLVQLPQFDFQFYKSTLAQYGKQPFRENLIQLLKAAREAPELDLNPHQFSKFRKEILSKLG